MQENIMTKNKKTTIVEYLDNYGKFSFKDEAFNDTDAIILCQTVYVHFDGLCDVSFSDRHSFSELQKKITSSLKNQVQYKDVGLMNKKIPELFLKAAKTDRFKDVQICGFTNKISTGTKPEEQEQFAAITYILDENTICIVFRGTDDSIIGWKEDCNLVHMEEIPSQRDALTYLDAAINAFPGKKVIVSGHSKGGNMAIYAGAKVSDEKKEKIIDIYNFDGPGFSKEKLQSTDFLAIKDRIHTWYPEKSVVGMLFDHYDNFKIVQSTAKLVFIMQHDLSTWLIDEKLPMQNTKLSYASTYMNEVLNNWFENLPEEKKQPFIKSLFSVLEATGKSNMSQMIGDIQNDFESSSLQFKKDIRKAGKMLTSAENTINSGRKDKNAKKVTKGLLKTFSTVGLVIKTTAVTAAKHVFATGKGTVKGVSSMLDMTKASIEIIKDEEQRVVIFDIVNLFITSGVETSIEKSKQFLEQLK